MDISLLYVYDIITILLLNAACRILFDTKEDSCDYIKPFPVWWTYARWRIVYWCMLTALVVSLALQPGWYPLSCFFRFIIICQFTLWFYHIAPPSTSKSKIADIVRIFPLGGDADVHSRFILCLLELIDIVISFYWMNQNAINFQYYHILLLGLPLVAQLGILPIVLCRQSMAWLEFSQLLDIVLETSQVCSLYHHR